MFQVPAIPLIKLVGVAIAASPAAFYLLKYTNDLLVLNALTFGLNTGIGVSIAYQPLKRLGELDKDSYFFEALIRLEIEGHAITPSRFMPMVLADDELSIKLDEFVLSQVAKKMTDSGHQYAVNLTAASLHSAELPKTVELLFCKQNALNDLVLEVIENQEIVCLKTLDRLHAITRVWLDDCGKIHSNLDAIANLPIHGVKIDGGFTKRMIRDRKSRAIIRSLFQLCEDLRFSCVIEWVESPAQIELIERMASDYPRLDLWIQGYFVGVPH